MTVLKILDDWERRGGMCNDVWRRGDFSGALIRKGRRIV